MICAVISAVAFVLLLARWQFRTQETSWIEGDALGDYALHPVASRNELGDEELSLEAAKQAVRPALFDVFTLGHKIPGISLHDDSPLTWANLKVNFHFSVHSGRLILSGLLQYHQAPLRFFEETNFSISPSSIVSNCSPKFAYSPSRNCGPGTGLNSYRLRHDLYAQSSLSQPSGFLQGSIPTSPDRGCRPIHTARMDCVCFRLTFSRLILSF